MVGAGGRASSSSRATVALAAAVSASAVIGSYLVWRRVSSSREKSKNAESGTSCAGEERSCSATKAEDSQDDTIVSDESGVPASIGGENAAPGDYAAAAAESEEHLSPVNPIPDFIPADDDDDDDSTPATIPKRSPRETFVNSLKNAKENSKRKFSFRGKKAGERS